MQSFNQDSYGKILYVNFGEDVSTATAYELEIEPQSGDVKTATPTLGTSNVVVGDETFNANEFVKYTIIDSFFDQYVGKWRVKGKATMSSTSKIVSNYIDIRIMP